MRSYLPSTNKTASSMVSNMTSKYPEVDKFFEQAANAMLGYGPTWKQNLLSSVASTETSYPPYDLIRLDDNTYQVVIAAAGFSKDDLDVVVENSRLTVTGEKQKVVHDTEQETSEKSEPEYLHRGIATRKFTRSFMLSDNVHVTKADFVDGLLTLELVHEIPEEQKPKQIPIS
jgi:molecular chaperone IbpA